MKIRDNLGSTWSRTPKRVGSLVILIILIVIGAGAIILFYPTLDQHEGTAAWVQAVGAIAVIWATAWIANENFSQERHRTREAERHLWESVATLSGGCLSCLDHVLKNVRSDQHLEDDFKGAYSPTDFVAPMEGIAVIPLHQLGSVDLVTAVISLRRVMSRIRTRLDAFYEHLTTQSVSQSLDLKELLNQRVDVFNAYASIMRAVYGVAAEGELSRLATLS